MDPLLKTLSAIQTCRVGFTVDNLSGLRSTAAAKVFSESVGGPYEKLDVDRVGAKCERSILVVVISRRLSRR